MDKTPKSATKATRQATIRERTTPLWAALWRSKNKLDGISHHLINVYCVPKLFSTRRDARLFINKHYGFIRSRKDLRNEPHGWRMPIPVRVKIKVQ